MYSTIVDISVNEEIWARIKAERKLALSEWGNAAIIPKNGEGECIYVRIIKISIRKNKIDLEIDG